MTIAAKKTLLLFTLLLLSHVALARSDEAPVPRKSPPVPVNREWLAGAEGKRVPRDLEGAALLVDAEHLRIDDIDVRLFGVVPPQLSASFGPQARAALDSVIGGKPVSCHIRDRDQAGRFLATCQVSGSGNDLALELLRRGLAVTARGSLQPTELAAPYLAAEQAAQTQRLGLWSVTVPSAVSLTAMVPAGNPKTENANPPPPLPPTPPSELKREEKSAAPSAPEKEKAPVVAAVPATTVDIMNAPREEYQAVSSRPGFFARYQLLIAGVLMLLTATGIMGAIEYQRRRDRRDETKAIAAALRGELLAARAVCQARIRVWSEADEKSAAWPRIRSTLYQAYVGRIGWLGATLARQIASIYGQASDYAAYYSNAVAAAPQVDAPPSRRMALQVLERHIEDVLPRLALIEQTGQRPADDIAPPVAVKAPPPSPDDLEPDAPPRAEPAAAADVAEPDEAPSAPSAAPASSAWENLKKLARLAGNVSPPAAAQDAMPDYAALIEEESARFSFESEASGEKPSSAASRLHGTRS